MIVYEWVVEEMDGEEILNVSAFGKLSEAKIFSEGLNVSIALRRDVGNDLDGITDRQYAYAGDVEFEHGAKIPKHLLGDFATLGTHR